ncbi:putative glutathione S-transferase domain superfamily [Helianthus annuus]|nr:putative glutathione S-transferase domain superfamily [Helianthus annuus]
MKTKPFCHFVQIHQIDQWIDFSSFEIDAHIRGRLYPIMRFGSYIKRAEESSIAGLKRGFDALNSYLASHTFLVGDGVTWVEEEEAPKPKLKFLGGSFTCDAYYTAASTRFFSTDTGTNFWRYSVPVFSVGAELTPMSIKGTFNTSKVYLMSFTFFYLLEKEPSISDFLKVNKSFMWCLDNVLRREFLLFEKKRKS